MIDNIRTLSIRTKKCHSPKRARERERKREKERERKREREKERGKEREREREGEKINGPEFFQHLFSPYGWAFIFFARWLSRRACVIEAVVVADAFRRSFVLIVCSFTSDHQTL